MCGLGLYMHCYSVCCVWIRSATLLSVCRCEVWSVGSVHLRVSGLGWMLTLSGGSV